MIAATREEQLQDGTFDDHVQRWRRLIWGNLTAMRSYARLRAKDCGIPAAVFFSPGKRKHVARSRQQAMYEIYCAFSVSLPLIGRAFYRDHSTVLHAVRKVQAERDAAGLPPFDPAIVQRRLEREGLSMPDSKIWEGSRDD